MSSFSRLARPRMGFTLIELLIVVAIIGILSSLLMAGLGTATRRAREATIRSGISNIDLSCNAYHQDEGFYPGRFVTNAGDDLVLAQALYKALRNRQTRAAGGGRNSPYHEPGVKDIGRAAAADSSSGSPAPDVADLFTAEPLAPEEGGLIDQLAFQTGAGNNLVFVDALGNYFHYREWESRSEATKNAQPAPRNRTRFDLWSNGLNGKNQSNDFWANVGLAPDFLADAQADALDDIGNFDR